ncbi:MAG: DUF1015 domain-containing protein [Candidatus Riflebacteria bacterium]|nr:DUF1015 domain-containing protein [Candidatus Riflebacteria bacterium]
MAILRPFPALCPPARSASLVAAVPHDTVDADEARTLAEGNPLSLLHVTRPEIDLPPSIDARSDAVLAQGLESFERLVREAPLTLTDGDRLFVYSLRRGDHTQTGVAGCLAVAECSSGVVRPHERAPRSREDDRTRHLVTLRAQTEPVLACYRDSEEIDRLVERSTHRDPLFDFTASDGVAHTVWAVDQPADLVEAFARVPRLYLADGHATAAAACRASIELAGIAGRAGDPERGTVLAVAFPASQLESLPCHRLVKDLGGLTRDHFLAAVREVFHARETASPSAPRKGLGRMYFGGRWYGLDLASKLAGTMVIASREEPHNPILAVDLPVGGTISGLDVYRLQERLLRPFLGIVDPRTDRRIESLSGARDDRELVRRVDAGLAVCAFSLSSISVQDLMKVADEGDALPPGSTWFEPKLRSGLFIHQTES